METTIPQLTTLTKSDLVHSLKNGFEEIKFSENYFLCDAIKHQSMEIAIINHSKPDYKKNEINHSEIIGLYDSQLEQIENYVKSVNANFKLFKISSHYFGKTQTMTICFIRELE